MFLGRQKELAQIKSMLNSNRKQALMIYGKRRVGKSTLILEAIKKAKCKVIYYECLYTSLEENLRNIESRIQKAFNNNFLHFKSFSEIFEYFASLKEKIVVVLDEYAFLKDSAPKYYVDSMFQSIIDSMSDNISLVLLGSFVGVMKELLEKENPLFGRFSLVLNLKPFDYYDSSLFYSKLNINDKICFYSVFGGTPFASSFIDSKKSLEKNIIDLIINPNGILGSYVENVLLSELSKVSNANMILSALANGKKRYSDLESFLGIKSNGLLDKQLKTMIEMEIVRKVFPINKRNDKKKTFYEISDNLVRFYYQYIYKNKDVVWRIGEEAFYKSYIEPNLKTFISHRFEEITREYFTRKCRMEPESGILDVGSVWYDIPSEHKNGEFDCVIKYLDSYSVYEVKYYQNPLTAKEAELEYKKILELGRFINIEKVGFLCSSGYEFSDSRFHLISPEELYACHYYPVKS